MKSIADRQKLYQDYISHYESRSHEGNVTLCDEKLEYRGDTQLCDSPAALGGFYSQLIKQNLENKKQEPRVEVLKKMMKGCAILELICVNLFLFPWRKEIRTLKKFTGNFVYFVEPVIPEVMIRQILQQVGYTIASDTEYTIGGNINTEEAKKTAFELYLCRIQCENLLRLMNEDRSASVSLLVNGCHTKANSGRDHTGDTAENTSRTAVDVTSNVTSNNDTTEAADLSITHTSSHMDSYEFLNKYNDLNLAQKPIFPLHSKQNKPMEWTTPVSVSGEPIVSKSPERDPGSTHLSGGGHAEKVTCGLQSDNIDIMTFTDKVDPPKSLLLNDYTSEVIVPTKQERVVTKLKMQNVSGESLAYPIEETIPPDSIQFSDSCDSSKKELRWAFRKSKEGASPVSLSSDFSMLNISSKPATWAQSTENKLQEPPNSTYIPPESECMKLTNIKTEDNHFTAPSPVADTHLVDIFNIQEDAKEDYVMITRKDHPNN
ncbi:uncharacterized protein RB166_012945 [Leptodactylus fuscus]|uniref:uncharacterized protein LOC142213577 n=1 Tax=Leptodactylus fuscus TaxID=238119 RepID=UPI003F4EF506